MSRIEMAGVSFAYGERSVLRELTLCLEGGGITLVLGRNGSGKSTLLRLLAGVLRPAAGTVRLDGADLSGLAPRVRARAVAWLAQQAAPSPYWSVFDFVMGGRYPHHGPLDRWNAADRERTRQALGDLRIEDLAGRALTELSGGEWQLTRIARLLAQATPVLLLDEPFGPLDVRHRADLWSSLARSDRLTVAVAHDLSLAGGACNRVVLLDRGGVVASGPPANVLTPETLARTFDWHPPPGWRFQPFTF